MEGMSIPVGLAERTVAAHPPSVGTKPTEGLRADPCHVPTFSETVSDLSSTVAEKVSSAGSGLKEQLSGLSRASMSSVKSLGRRHSDDSDAAAEEPTTPRGSSVPASEGDAVKASCLPISCLTSSKKLA